MIPHQGKLEYFLSEKQDFLVVSLVGYLNKTTAASLDVCREEVQKSQARFVVLSFHDVQQIEPGAIPNLIRLEKAIRDKPGGNLRLCFLAPSFERFLHESGAIRPNEIASNLLEALQTFASLKKVAA